MSQNGVQKLAWRRKATIQPKKIPSVKNQSKSNKLASSIICFEMM